MNQNTHSTLTYASTKARRTGKVVRVTLDTPDRRVWSVRAQPTGGFSLLEVDPTGRRQDQEHDAAEGQTWDAGDLIDYLKAVGTPTSAK